MASWQSLHSNHMLNRGYAYTTIISSKDHGLTLLSRLARLYSHSSPQVWQRNLDNGEVTLNGLPAIGSEWVRAGQTLVWNRPPWIEPDAPRHYDVLLNDPYLLAVNKPGGLPTLPGGGFMENTLLRLVQKDRQLHMDFDFIKTIEYNASQKAARHRGEQNAWND